MAAEAAGKITIWQGFLLCHLRCHVFRDKTVAVSSDSAEHEDEVKLLTEIAAKVYFCSRMNHPAAAANVELLAGQKIRQLTGSAMLEELELTDGSKLKVDGVFLLKSSILNANNSRSGLEDKHIKVDLQMATNIPGVFACGDVVGRPTAGKSGRAGTGCRAGCRSLS